MTAVYENGNLLSSQGLADAANAIGKGFAKEDYPNRLKGSMCACGPNKGIFDLLPANDAACIEGGKRYMVCRNCGCYSHL
jgi:hypothetical protein